LFRRERTVSVRHELFVVVAPGLETLAVAEAKALGLRAKAARAGYSAQATTRQLYALHQFARIPTRVLIRINEGRAPYFDDLIDLVRETDWRPWLERGSAVFVTAASHGSRLYHTEAISERVVQGLGRRVADDGIGIMCRIDRDIATLSVDATAASMHHRGWRSVPHVAPLRATLASAMIQATGWDGSTSLVDPMAGSGTIGIEAARWAMGKSVGVEREYSFQRFASFEPGTWASVTGTTPTNRLTAPIYLADRDEGAVAGMDVHAQAASVREVLTIEHGALSNQQWPDGPGWVITNPPYGARVGGGDPRDLLAKLGTLIRERGYHAAVLLPPTLMPSHLGLAMTAAFSTTNGGKPVTCWVMD
jgi:putative N6-adenine-specific DNA methylase